MIHRLDPFYLIVDDAAWIERLVPQGVRLVQLRCKNPDVAVVREEIRRAKAVCARYECMLIINDHWREALDLACEFVHLGQEDLDSADTVALRRAGVRLGLSTHDHDELERALTHDPAYVALGPIYPTVLKQMPWAPQGLDRIREWKARVGARPLVAIGGLTVERLAGVFGAGADSAAVVTDITRHENPEARTLEWIATTRSSCP